MAKVETTIISEDALRNLCVQILKAAKVNDNLAHIVTDHLVDADLTGHGSHGVAVRLPRYLKLMENGHLNPDAEIKTVVKKPSMAVLDGGWCFGQAVANKSLELCMQKAKELGSYSITFRNTNHIGRLGYYGEIAARKGYIFFMVASVLPGNRQSHPDSAEALLGTNPICFAFNWKKQLILTDTSTSAIAEGKVAVLKARKKEAPRDSLRDQKGNETLDPNILYEKPPGSIWPLGGSESGYKGFALAVMVDMLSGLPSGGGLSGSDAPSGTNCGFMHIIDPTQIVSSDRIDEKIELWMNKMRSAKTLSGDPSIMLPGDFEVKNRIQKQTEGIEIDPENWNELKSVAHSYNVTDI